MEPFELAKEHHNLDVLAELKFVTLPEKDKMQIIPIHVFFFGQIYQLNYSKLDVEQNKKIS